jgi:phosphatidate cytidylyltransferase
MTVLLLVGGLFALAGALIVLAGLTPAGRKVATELWPFYRSEFLIVGAVLLPSAAGPWAFAILLAAMAARGQFELLDLFGQAPRLWFQKLTLAMGAALAALGVLSPENLPAAVPAALLAVAFVGLTAGAQGRRVLLPTLASLVYPAALVCLTGVLRAGENGFLWLFLAQGVVETNDSFALLVGKLMGRTRPFPNLSPGKTLAGLVGGALAGAGVGFVIARYLIGLAPLPALAAVAVTLLAGLAGDLLVSALKRSRGVKDFRPVALIHGGLLDIYDSLLFAAPALLALRALL